MCSIYIVLLGKVFYYKLYLPLIQPFTHTHTQMAPALHGGIGGNFGFGVLLKDTLTCGQVEERTANPVNIVDNPPYMLSRSHLKCGSAGQGDPPE